MFVESLKVGVGLVYPARVMHARDEAGAIAAVIAQSVDIDSVPASDAVVDLEIDGLPRIDTDLSGETLNLRVALIVDRSVDGPSTLRCTGLLVFRYDWI